MKTAWVTGGGSSKDQFPERNLSVHVARSTGKQHKQWWRSWYLTHLQKQLLGDHQDLQLMPRDAELLRQSQCGPEMGLVVGEGAVPEISQTQQQLSSLGLCSILNEHFV